MSLSLQNFCRSPTTRLALSWNPRFSLVQPQQSPLLLGDKSREPSRESKVKDLVGSVLPRITVEAVELFVEACLW